MNVLDTAAPTSYIVGGDGGSDEFTMGNRGWNFDANTYNGTLANILGHVPVFPDYNNTAGTDTLNVDASSDSPWPAVLLKSGNTGVRPQDVGQVPL